MAVALLKETNSESEGREKTKCCRKVPTADQSSNFARLLNSTRLECISRALYQQRFTSHRKISPERSQRKRRCTTEVLLTVPSSTEDKVTEELIESVCDDSKVRLEKPAEESVGEKSAPLAKTCVKTNENGILGGIDKTPFVQKKIKIFPRSEKKPEEPKEVESCRNIAERQDRTPFGKLLRKKSSEALRVPEGAKKDKESVFKRDEKVSEMDPRRPSRFRNAPQPQQPSNRVMQHAADPGSVDGILKKKGPSPDQTSDQPPQKETKVTQRNPSTQNEVSFFSRLP